MIITGPFSIERATEREWLLTNGLGGYASSTLCGMNTRRYHGLLVAALHPPGARNLLVSKLEETLSIGENIYLLATNQYPGTYYPHGVFHLNEFALEDDAVAMRFAIGTAGLEKLVTMVQGENTTHVRYRNTGTTPFALTLTPLVNARDFHGETAAESIPFQINACEWRHGPAVQVIPGWLPAGYWLYANDGTWQREETWNRNMCYLWEQRRGLNPQDNHFSPGNFQVELAPGAEMTVVLSQLPPETPAVVAPAFSAEVRPGSPDDPAEIRQLFHTARSFLVERSSASAQALAHGRTVIAGYHWFGDWGRDTMIALPGLCLTTGRYAEAAEILRTFAAARRRGLLPNLFLDSGEGEAYNTVDAALWFVQAVDQYYRATGDAALVTELRQSLEEVIHYYRYGTDFGIGMEPDGLIKAGAPGWQLTWMDAKVGNWVVTPRAGKPVEINALWYNALCIMAAFADAFGWQADYAELAARVQQSFSAFWYAKGKYLYDLLGDQPDASLRPNQIFAVSLPHSPLDAQQAASVLRSIERHLLTPYGLRTLSPHDPAYRGVYGGTPLERDGAYHQGTVWAWLIGPYVDAYLRVHGDTPAAKTACRRLLQPLLAHVWDAGLGSISEIFDGNTPHLPKGTISQAWSVAEVLRAWEACRE